MISLAYGMPGSGKSTLLHDLVRSQFLSHRFFVVDHEAQWGPDGVHWRNRPPPISVFYKGQHELPAEFPDHGVFVFRGYDGREVAEIARLIGWATLVDDEADKACRKQGFDTSAMRAIANEGRHLVNAAGEYTEVHFIGACRRPQKLHNDISELADQIFVFRCQGVRTLGRLLDDNHIEEADEARIQNLPNFHFKHWPSGDWLTVEPVKPRASRVVSATAQPKDAEEGNGWPELTLVHLWE